MRSAPVVAFVGSRSLSPRFAPQVAGALSSFLPSHRIAVGCCIGLDEMVLAGLTGAGLADRLAVFAAFGPAGAGACAASAVGAVAAAAAAGARLRLWSGGGPAVPLRARLSRRSAAVVRAAAAGGPGSGLVAFLASPASVGSLAACRLAARSGLPVVAWSCGFPGPPPLLGAGGRWVPAQPAGFWSDAWAWDPDLEVQLPTPPTREMEKRDADNRTTGYQHFLPLAPHYPQEERTRYHIKPQYGTEWLQLKHRR